MLELPSVEPTDAQPLIDLLRSHGVTLVSARPVRQSLEDLFIDAMRESGDATPGAVRGAPAAGERKGA